MQIIYQKEGSGSMSETRKLYYEDVYKKEFTAKVLECGECEKGFAVILDQTAFYPEGGGQPCDLGTLNGIAVLDVQEKDGEIVHYTKEAVEAGSEVIGKIDWNRRFDLMQQHSGEHIVSGLVHEAFGYDNVGFHLHDIVTVDFNGMMTWQDALDIEREANEIIWKDEETKISFPSKEELSSMDYRSKIELDGTVRIVEFPEGDTCACCGTHVSRAGEVGIVKVLSLARHKGGVRIELVCGRRAMEMMDKIYDLNEDIAVRFSVKPFETKEAVEKQAEEKAELMARLADANRCYFALKAGVLAEGKRAVLLYEEELNAGEIRKFCEYLTGTGKDDIYFVLSKKDQDSLNYAIGSAREDLRPLIREWNKALHGRGGGRSEMVQGSFSCRLSEAEDLVRSLNEEM